MKLGGFIAPPNISPVGFTTNGIVGAEQPRQTTYTIPGRILGEYGKAGQEYTLHYTVQIPEDFQFQAPEPVYTGPTVMLQKDWQVISAQTPSGLRSFLVEGL
jgi:hypothetical protein